MCGREGRLLEEFCNGDVLTLPAVFISLLEHRSPNPPFCQTGD